MSDIGPHKTTLTRYSLKNIRGAIMRELNLEKGVLFTIVNLIRRPGIVINQHLFEDRSKMIKPVTFIFITVGLVTFLTLKFSDITTAINLDQVKADSGEFGYNW